MSAAPSSWYRSTPALALLFSAAYYLLALLSYGAALAPAQTLAAWWAPSGLALAVLIRAERRALPWFLAGIALAAGAINVSQPIGLAASLYRTLADLLEPLVAASLLRRAFGRKLGLKSLKEVSGFALLGGLAGPTVGGLVVGLGGALFEGPSAEGAAFALVWWGSAALGAVLFAPVLLTWRAPRRFPAPPRVLESTLLGAALVLLSVAAFLVPGGEGMRGLVGFAAFPLLAWAAVRFGQTGAARATVMLSVLSLWPILSPGVDPRVWQVIAVQGTYAVAALTALALSALTSETHLLRARAQAQADRAEEALALLESALRNGPFAFAFFDPTLRLIRCNAAFAGLEGRTAADLVGSRLPEALPVVAGSLEPLLGVVLADGRVAQRDVETPSATRRAWLCSAFPVTAGEQAIGVGLLMIDLTGRKAEEEERNRLFHQAQEAVRVREDFLSIASHELKTPLTPLAVRLSAIQRTLEAGGRIGPESLDKPLQSLRKLTELINDLLDASRIEHGRLLLNRRPLPFDQIVRQATEPFRSASPRHKVVLQTPPELLWVHADRERMVQVVANLVDNAIKYSPGGGTVEVVVRPHPEGVELVVSDHGIGVPPEQLERLFERYYRAANATGAYGGLGLGLYITRDIVDRHEGRIWAQSEPGVGSQFHVVLPRLATAHAEAALH